jgi:hypothetical protein
MALRRLERAGKLTFADEDVRERYETMKRAGLFGDEESHRLALGDHGRRPAAEL